MDYGLLEYTHYTNNLGDEIQSIAARQFLPRVDTYVSRDNMWESDPDRDVFIIGNGWFTHRPDNFPPPPNIHPFWISLHLHDADMLNRKMVEHFKAHEPIGAREPYTFHMLRQLGISVYWSACLTLTFQNTAQERSDKVYIVDVVDELLDLIPKELLERAERLTHERRDLKDKASRFKAAEDLLHKYSRASLVIAGKLHCALSCAALGTPCVMLHVNKATDPRFVSLKDRFIYICSREDAGRIDWSPGPVRVPEIAAFLREAAQEAVARCENPFKQRGVRLPPIMKTIWRLGDYGPGPIA